MIKTILTKHNVINMAGGTAIALTLYFAVNPTAMEKIANAVAPTAITIQAHKKAVAVVVKTKKAVETQAQIETAHATNGWVEDFTKLPNGPLSSSDWNIESGTTVSDYNNEAEAYTASTDNVRIDNGSLVIEAKPQILDGKSYTSARINTDHKFSFTYGTIDVTMKLPAGKGTWPAAWLLPEDNIYSPSTYGISSSDPDAWALNGEIDFEESVGTIPGQNIPAAHSYDQMRTGTIYTPGIVTNPYTQFHTYGVIKTPTSITFTIDGVPYASRTKSSNSALAWPYNQPYYLIIDLALGGSWAGAQGIDNTTAPWLLNVQNITYTPLQD